MPLGKCNVNLDIILHSWIAFDTPVSLYLIGTRSLCKVNARSLTCVEKSTRVTCVFSNKNPLRSLMVVIGLLFLFFFFSFFKF